jgi:hypothetical protein
VDVREVDPTTFLAEAGPLLREDEARHNLILAIAGTLCDEPLRYPDHSLWLVRDRKAVVGAALRTRPFNLVLAAPRDPAAIDALAGAIGEELPGAVGGTPEVEAFAAAWAAKTGTTLRRKFAQGVFALERVNAVAGVSGRMRPAAEDDRPLLIDWMRAFSVEALFEETPDEERLAEFVDYRLTSDVAGLVLWDDGGPVSLAGFGGPTPNGIRVGPVYTPPELRGHGYASALVAELSAELLAGGRRFCFLYTDLANPTSNKIYERIGYVRVCDSAEIAFI